MSRAPRRAIGFYWHHFSAYHMDRCEALGQALAGEADVIGLEVASTSVNYGWGESGQGRHFTKETLFPGQVADRIGGMARLRKIIAITRRRRITDMFLAGYERPDIFAAAIALTLMGVRVYVTLDSKFDDKPRRLPLELVKAMLLLPYRGGFAAGRRAREYLNFLGLRRRRVTEGYDTVSLDRLRTLASAPPPAWEQRPFLAVARFIPKKNLGTLIAAYAQFRQRHPQSPRRLNLCGGGQLEGELRAQADRLGIADHVDFMGFLPQPAIADAMAGALCLLLPSREEQWGLVVNEALAFSLPILVSNNVGAIDTLVRPLGNGFVLDPEDAAAWADAMDLIATDRPLWERFAAHSAERAPLADVSAFVDGVCGLTGIRAAERAGEAA
ncbi:glycosyltransferase [Sphingomonas sp. CJ99]